MKRLVLVVVIVAIAASLSQQAAMAGHYYDYPTIITPNLYDGRTGVKYKLIVCNTHQTKTANVSLQVALGSSYPSGVFYPVGPWECVSTTASAVAGQQAVGVVQVDQCCGNVKAKDVRVGFYVIDASGRTISAVSERRKAFRDF